MVINLFEFYRHVDRDGYDELRGTFGNQNNIS